MTNRDIDHVMRALGEHFQAVKTPIVDLIQATTNDPFKVLVGTILSARTKDETTLRLCIGYLSGYQVMKLWQN
ncbi:MAG: hypothetical protein LRZ88_02045 [Candidatus Cloacimonetes bacterium]|nr:hypothetical protein [Candidatus Cloacimonadota bacterium]